MLWSKGVDILLALMEYARRNDEEKDNENSAFPIDLYGSGSDLDDVRSNPSLFFSFLTISVG